MVLRAVVVLPLLLMIMCYGVVIAALESVVNVDAKRDNALSFVSSVSTPILLGLVSIFLRRFISTWLNWSPQGTEPASGASYGQEVSDELLEPELVHD